MKPVDVIQLYGENGREWTPDDPEWHAIRGKGLGGSDMGTICGLNPWKSPYTLWAEKTGLVPRVPAGEAAYWGTVLEEPVAVKLAKDAGLALIKWNVTLRSKENPILLANVDRFVVEPSELYPKGQVTTTYGNPVPDGMLGLAEIKTAGVYAADAWNGEKIPEAYQLQAQYYMMVTGLPFCYFGCLVTGQKLEIRILDADPELHKDLEIVANNFWELVKTKTPPEIDNTKSTTESLKLLQRESGKKVELGEDFRTTWDWYQHYSALAKEADAEKSEAYNAVVAALGDGEIATINGEVVCTFKASQRSSLQTENLKRDHPELVEEYTVKKPVRTLRKAGKVS